jgi:hypothetical protein
VLQNPTTAQQPVRELTHVARELMVLRLPAKLHPNKRDQQKKFHFVTRGQLPQCDQQQQQVDDSWFQANELGC